MSNLRTDIYAAIAALPLTYGGSALTVFNVDKLPHSVESASLPARLLTPLAGRGRGTLAQFETIKGNPSVNWQVVELLLAGDEVLGTGPVDHTAPLVDFEAQYASNIYRLRAQQWILVGWTCEADVINWPEGSERFYYGARTTLTIREYIPRGV